MALPSQAPHAVVVYESMFGNTADVAAAVARGLQQQGVETTCTDVREADPSLLAGADLLVLGGPTHAFTLSRPSTRDGAVSQGAEAGRATAGLREWISENIRVRSVLGRFLEHSRVYAFGTGEDEDSEVWIASADMMHRNLDRRVELAVQVVDAGHQRGLRRFLDIGMDDRTSSWWLNGDGHWTRHSRDEAGNPLRDVQETLVRERRVRSADD